MSVKSSNDAEDKAKKFLKEKFNYENLVVMQVDFDNQSQLFLVDVTVEKDQIEGLYKIKIDRNGYVVGWKEEPMPS